MATVLPNGQQYYHNQPFYHPMSPQPGNPPMQQAADQRYAALRLQQAVKAGVIDASVLNAHPNTYPALWRMVSEKITAPAQAAGYKDPGYWLRMGGPQVGGQGGVDTSKVPGSNTNQASDEGVGNQDGGGDVVQRYLALLQHGGQAPEGSFDPAKLDMLYQIMQQMQGGQSPRPNLPAN